MAEKKTIELEVKTNIDSAKGQFDSLSKSIDKTTKSASDLDATFEEVYGDLQPLTTRMGEAEDRLYELALAGKETTDEYKNLLNVVANYRRTQIQTDLVVDSAATTLSQKMTGAVSGVAGAFSAAQGAMGLFGSESENVQKALLKVQSAMALSQGIESIVNAKNQFLQLGSVIKTKLIGAFSSLKSAIVSTGIGLFVIAIGVLIANFDKLKNVVSENTANAQKFADSTRMEGVAARETANDFAEYERTLKRLGYAEDEIRKKRGNKLKDAIASTEKEIEANKKLYKEQLKNLETVYKYDKLGLNATGRALYGSEEDAAKTREYIKELRKDLEKLKNDQFDLQQKEKEEEKTADKVVKSSKKKVVAKKDELAEKLKAEKDYLEEISKVEESWLRLIADIAEKQQSKQNKDKEDRIQAAKKAEEDIYHNAKGFLQAAVIDDENNLQAKKDLLEVEKEILLQNKELTEGEIASIEAKYRKDREQLDKDELVKKQHIEQQKLRMAQDSIGVLQDALSLFTAKNEKDARRQFKINKALSLSSAIVNTALAVTGALTAGGNPIKLATGAQFVEAGIAAASGGVSIAKISATQFGGFGSSDTGGSGNKNTPSTPSTSSGVIAPKFNVVGASTNQLNTLQQQPIQAYVVSGDVTSAQSLDRNRIKNATL